MQDLEFGPPRKVSSLDAFGDEVIRQRRLDKAGYLRSIGGVTYAWSVAQTTEGDTVWSWTNVYHTYVPTPYRAFEDHETAWNYIKSSKLMYA